MGRKPRVEFQGAIYHVIKRGNNRDYIFQEREDKEDFLKCLEAANEEDTLANKMSLRNSHAESIYHNDSLN
ncbi:hypothetical protein [Acetobacterium malicum]|uniref:hypothetical protein n=1 Tax=Acetobacterium malicum TaxID=52692 RepID=UPI00040FF125|nr:hypothetical protein [Acetobacterium dehalogenans]